MDVRSFFRTNRDVKYTRNHREIIVGVIPHDLTNIRDDVSYHAHNTIIYLSFVILTLFDYCAHR